ncbi:DUF6774 domain-containing protein [Sinanaerobacter sp. ZZT-01]|uniref:DUF6774 domain-containing protein n=1 Tax=Sinanaerobacter sp. ZZT-01 TaxID=3111540 RepID=UPI002D764ACE|nr:DUF6774 domain-containing protein [Sinanaerobacter sp. ZZT-01]WRR94307.1 DUF6774 domain-containing protein [Sinanaerobacter sp. ZZT-01]
MTALELTYFITTVSNLIAKDKTEDELTLLSVMFTQLGDTLATISVLIDTDSE